MKKQISTHSYYILNNKAGEPIIDCCLDFASDFIDGLARIKYNGQWAYIDVKGNIIL